MAAWKQHRLIVWLAIVNLLAVVVTVFLYANDAPSEVRPNKWTDLRIHWTRCLLVAATIELLIGGIVYRRRVRALLSDFFCATAGPLNLALLRICVFALLFPGFNFAALVWHLELPESLRVPPLGLDWAAATPLFNQQLALAAAVVFSVMCICAMLGAFTRWTVPLATLLGLWVYGLPQFDGKVDHSAHHLIWFATLLSVAPCGHALSIDALRSAWRNPDSSSRVLRRESRLYALPMRFVWLLLGIIYFFPGVWKLWSCGLDWALTDNLKYHLYFKWAELGGWTPSFRIDSYPLLYRAAGLATIVFEVGFIFCIFTARGRTIALVAGIGFHRSVSAFMRIAFWPLEWCYIALVDWHRLFRKVGKQIFPTKCTVRYDGAYPRIGRVLACVCVFDILQRVRFVPTRETKAGILEFANAKTDRPCRDKRAAIAMLCRIPLLYALVPFVAVTPTRWFVFVLTSHRADHHEVKRLDSRERKQSRLRVIWVTGALLVITNVFFGSTRATDGWPFCCYPTFDSLLTSPYQWQLKTVAVLEDGREIEVDYATLGPMGSAGARRLRTRLLASHGQENYTELLTEFWTLLKASVSDGSIVARIRFYRVLLSTVPNSDPHFVQAEMVREYDIATTFVTAQYDALDTTVSETTVQ
jgi:hypothetical protein